MHIYGFVHVGLPQLGISGDDRKIIAIGKHIFMFFSFLYSIITA